MEKSSEESTGKDKRENARESAKTINDFIAALKDEAARIRSKGSELTEAESERLRMIQHTISWLISVRDQSEPQERESGTPPLITYKVISDRGDKLKSGARTACNFWNRFIEPAYPVVIRLGTCTKNSATIAMAYRPFVKNKTKYGMIEFNTSFLGRFSGNEIAGTIVHEIGHILGIGYETWEGLFNHETGRFTPEAVSRLASLEQMEVERNGSSSTALAHWDEELFDKELMTGYKDKGEHVLPVTIDVMEMLGHRVTERLEKSTDLDILLSHASDRIFSRQDEVRSLDLEYYEETEPFETIPHGKG